MREVKVCFENGYYFTTKINGTDEEILKYYKIGNVLNIGSVYDNMQKIIAIEFI